MALRICSLSSGSTGNCIYVASDKTRILIDAGIPFDRIQRSLRVLGANGGDVSVLVTHAHNDHVSCLSPAARSLGAQVFAHSRSAEQVKKRGKFSLTEFDNGEFTIGDISVTPFELPHDAPCVGFTLRHKNHAVSILTDLGEADDATVSKLLDSDVLLIESNHDESLVSAGPYPWPLKKRILSRAGHLSNTACASVCVRAAMQGKAKQIILGHLSRENNSPELAFNTVVTALTNAGLVEGKDVSLEVAPACSLSGLYEVC